MPNILKTLPCLFILSLITSCIEIDMSVPSFPDISDYFNISDGLTQMTIAVNFFGFCISSVVCGPLSDSYGRRKIMIIGNSIMLVGALGCVTANNIVILLIFRFIQGLGASTSCVLVFAMIADVYPAYRAAKIIGQMNSLLCLFMTIAPILGAYINSYIGFKGNYLVIALVSFFSLIMLYLYLPETNDRRKKFKLKLIARNFCFLLKNKSFNYASLTPSIMYCGYLSFITSMPFLYMETYKLSMIHYVIHQGIIIFIFAIISMIFGRITNLIGEKNTIIYGVITNLIGGISALLIGLIVPDSPVLSTITMVLYSAGAAASYPVIFAKSLDIFPDIKGTASSTLMAMRALLLGIFIAFTSYIYNGTMLNVAIILLICCLLVTIMTFKLLKLISFDKKI